MLVVVPPSLPSPLRLPAVGRLRRKRRISFSFNLSPILTKSKTQFIYGDSSSSDDEEEEEDDSSEYQTANVAAVETRCHKNIYIYI